ncbi:MAG: hypothetical protein Q9181_006372 [Wetmoreana brouardii]
MCRMPKRDPPKPGKTSADKVNQAHFGAYNPSEEPSKTSSRKKPAGAAEDSHDPNETRSQKYHSSGSKGGGKGVRQAQAQTSSVQGASNPGENEEPKIGYHRDFLKRTFTGFDINELFLNPYDGRLCYLVVQGSQDILRFRPKATWYRTGLRNGSPWMIRLSNWAMSRDHGSEDTVGTNVATAVARWLPACAALSLVISLPIEVAATPTNFGRYDSFLYKDWRYPRDARNRSENMDDTQNINQHFDDQTRRSAIGKREKLAEPDYLCFIEPNATVIQSKVSEWTEENKRMTSADYVFVSFTGQHLSNDKFNHEYLREVGIHAARAIGVHAYWCSDSCLTSLVETDEKKKQKEKEQTVWNMSDIIRRARAVAIAVPGPLDAQFNGDSLKEWGNRCWTMPEVLLYTGDHPILIYESARSLDGKRQLPRRELWNKAWSDTAYSGQLIDHYEGSLSLTPLELNTVALHCLQNRFAGEYLEGDLAYVLMGLLRQRPEPEASDNEFQAFARLSLANDSNLLLERMICLLPNSLDADWWSLEDAWNVTLWDIYPKVQICGIGDGDTIIIDGARGAAIRWDKFVPVLTLGQETLRHLLIRWTLRIMPLFFLSSIPCLIVSKLAGGPAITGLLIAASIGLGLAGTIVLLSPLLLRLVYCTKTQDSQPFFFGIEGYLDKYQLELLIFGSYEGRLNWSVASSPLSRHSLDRDGMRRDFPDLDEESMTGQNMYTGLDPVKADDGVKDLVRNAHQSSLHEKKIFTLVDTYTMTVTLFEAVRPPIAVVVCGAEGGMQRALLCSEDWTTGTLYRETVMRIETRAWDKMDTLARIRMGLKREDKRAAIQGSQPSNV